MTSKFRYTLDLPGESNPQTAEDFSSGSVFFVGTATMIIRYAGFTILTDPNFLHQGEKAHAGYGLYITRQTNPALELEDLPPLDFVLLSHMHGDHFDQIVEQRLPKNLPIVTTEQAAADLKKKGFSKVYPLETWQAVQISKAKAKLQLTAMPGQHGPGMLSAALPQVMGSMLEFQTEAGNQTLRLYITGDTLLHDNLREIPQRYSEIDIAVLHLGGTRLFGVMLTMDGRQGVEVIKLMSPKAVVPIHYDDYEAFKSPLSDFKKHVEAAGLSRLVRYINRGESYKFTVPYTRLLITIF